MKKFAATGHGKFEKNNLEKSVNWESLIDDRD